MKSIPNLLPVVHCERTVEHALEQVKLITSVGVKGVFLISHSKKHYFLLKCYNGVRERFPDLWIGLNFLDFNSCPLASIHHMPETADGLWMDDVFIYGNSSDSDIQMTFNIAAAIERVKNRNWSSFASVAFKYIEPDLPNDQLITVAQRAQNLFDVVVTSGSATGESADHDKIWTIRNSIHNAKFAIASGITPENVDSYISRDWGGRSTTIVMAATGISKSFDEIDIDKLSMLWNNIQYPEPCF